MQVIDRFLPERLPKDRVTAARVVVGFAFGLAIVTPLGLLARLLVAEVPVVPTVIVLICSLAYAAVPWFLRATGSLTVASAVLILSLMTLILTSGWYAGGIGGPVMTIAPLLPLIATFLLGERTGRWMTAALFATLAVIFVLGYTGVELPSPELSERQELVARGLFLGISICLIALFAGVYHRQRTAGEEKLRRSRDLYRRLFEQSKDVVALTTFDGRLVDLNPAGVELMGFRSKEEALGQEVTRFYSDPNRRKRLLEHLETDGFVRNYESEIRSSSGEARIVEGTTSTIRGDSGKIEYLLAILQDVTEKRRAEAEREEMLAELTAVNEELKRFTHAVSHDLKSPLTTVRGFVGLLRRDARSKRLDRLERYAKIVDSGVETMGRIVDGLLKLALIGRGKLSRSRVALVEIARDAASLLGERIAEAGATVEIAPDLPVVEGDPAVLLTVLENLIDNGVKYSSESPAPNVQVGWRRDGDETVVTVTDNGSGIAAEDQRKVFDLFHQLRPEDEGSGIGLASVQRAVAAHGGRVWVESEGEGRGSTFCFTVPPPTESEVLEIGDQRRELLEM